MIEKELLLLGKEGYNLYHNTSEAGYYITKTGFKNTVDPWAELNYLNNTDEVKMLIMLYPHFVKIFDFNIIMGILQDDKAAIWTLNRKEWH